MVEDIELFCQSFKDLKENLEIYDFQNDEGTTALRLKLLNCEWSKYNLTQIIMSVMRSNKN